LCAGGRMGVDGAKEAGGQRGVGHVNFEFT
jgi:hypothetical protein